MKKLSDLAARLVDLKDQKDALELHLKEINEAIRKVATIDMPALMDEMGEEGFKCAAGTVYLQNKLYVSVNEDGREALYQALRDGGNGDLIREHVFPQTLTAYAKEQLEKGRPLPGMIKATFIPTASVRRTKTNGKS